MYLVITLSFFAVLTSCDSQKAANADHTLHVQVDSAGAGNWTVVSVAEGGGLMLVQVLPPGFVGNEPEQIVAECVVAVDPGRSAKPGDLVSLMMLQATAGGFRVASHHGEIYVVER